MVSKEATVGLLVGLVGFLVVLLGVEYIEVEPYEERFFVCVGFDDSRYKVEERELAFNDGTFILGQGMSGGNMYDVYVPVATLVGCGAEPK